MFGPLQLRDDEFHHGKGIQRPKDGGRHLLQTALEETHVENRVFHQLARVTTSQVFLVSVCHHMRPARNRSKGRRTAKCRHNWPQHRYLKCSIDCEAVNNIYSHPTESAFLPSSNEGPHCLATLLELQAITMMSICPPNHSRQDSREHSCDHNWLKAKQQCDSGMRRRGSGNRRNLPKLRLVSRRLHLSRAQPLAQTAPRVSQWGHSCLPSWAHPLDRTPWSGLAIEGRSLQLHQRSSPLRRDVPDPAQLEAPSLCSPSAAPAHPLSVDLHENPARATQLSQGASAGREQGDDAPDNAATLHGAHGWARTRFSCTADSRNGSACLQHLSPPSRKTSQPLSPRTPFSFGTSSWTELSGAPDLHLSRLR